MKKGIFSGTFNPVHFGHLIVAECVRDALSLSKVVFLPLARPWNKTEQDLAPAEDRLTMIEAAIAGNPGFDVSRVEIDTPRPRYDLDVLKKVCGDGVEASEYHCILGADALGGLPSWRNVDELLRLMRFAVVARPGHDSRKVLSKVLETLPAPEDRFSVVEAPLLSISSTDLRRRASTNRSLRYRVPDAVAEYIAENNLYNSRATTADNP